jgi:hypothetical protein
MDRIERLERKTGAKLWPDHVVQYVIDYGEDEEAKRAAALETYKATHTVKATDQVGYICLRIVSPDDPPEWKDDRLRSLIHVMVAGKKECAA